MTASVVDTIRPIKPPGLQRALVYPTIALSVLGFAWYPLAASPGMDGKFLWMYIFGLFILAATVSQIIGTNRLDLPSVDRVLLAVFLAGASLSALLSQNWLTVFGSSIHREGLITYLIYALTYIVFLKQGRSENIRPLTLALVAAVFANFFLGFTASSQKTAAFFSGRFTGSYGEPSFLAGFLLLALPLIALPAFSAGEDRRVKYLSMAALAVGAAMLVISGSRTGYLAASAAALAIFLFSLFRGRWSKLHALGVVLLLAIPFAVPRFSSDSLIAGFISRVETWKPILYTGGFLFAGAGPDRFRPLVNNRFRVWGAHNSFINEAADIGWLATAALILLILINAWRLIKGTAGAAKERRFINTALLAAITGYTFFCLGNYSRPYVNILFIAILGIAAGQTTRLRAARISKLSAGLVSGVGVLCAALIALGAVQVSMGNFYYWKYLGGLETRAPTESWALLSDAIVWEPGSALYRTQRGMLAFDLMNSDPQADTRYPGIRVALVDDWEFLLRECWNSREEYPYLEKAYLTAGVPREKWLPKPRLWQ